MGVCNCSMYCCTLLYVHSSIAIILMGKRELIAWLNLSSWCLVMVERLFLAVPRASLQFVIVVFPDHTHYFLWAVLSGYLELVNPKQVRVQEWKNQVPQLTQEAQWPSGRLLDSKLRGRGFEPHRHKLRCGP